MYDDITQSFTHRLKQIDKSIELKPKSKVLDLGCGPAGLSLALLRQVPLKEIYLLDLREDGLMKAKERIEAEHPETKIHIIKADVHKVPIEEGYFDFIISRGSMQFWKDQRQALSEIRRVLRPGGISYIGGGKGSVEFQEKRLKMDKGWFSDNFNKDKTYNSNKLKNEEYEDIFKSYNDRYKIYNHLGDGRWMMWEKSK